MSERSDRRLALGLLAAGLIGLVASTILLIERLRLAGDEDYVPTCSLNPVLSCGSIMESAQASLLGFPNPIIGVAAFPVVVATGAALLGGAIGAIVAALIGFGIGSATESSETGGKLYESKKSSTESNSSPSLSDSNRLSRVMPRFASALVIVDLFDWERPATAWSTVVKSSIR